MKVCYKNTMNTVFGWSLATCVYLVYLIALKIHIHNAAIEGGYEEAAVIHRPDQAAEAEVKSPGQTAQSSDNVVPQVKGQQEPKQVDLRKPQRPEGQFQTDNDHIIFNRVPKTGSVSIQAILKTVSYSNQFEYHGSMDYAHQLLNKEEQKNLSKEINSIPGPMIYDRVLFYVDFKAYGEKPPLYISALRDPVERLASVYYNAYAIKNVSYDDCVAQKLPQCKPITGMSRYFCGQHEDCKKPGPAYYALARLNLEKNYMLVGLTEDLLKFFVALEKLLPKFFRGTHDVYMTKRVDLMKKTKTKNKIKVTEATKKYMSSKLQTEYDFYNFAKQRFYQTYNKATAGH